MKKGAYKKYPPPHHTIDCEGRRNRLWKVSLQLFTDQTGLILEVCHVPPRGEGRSLDRTEIEDMTDANSGMAEGLADRQAD